MVAVVAVAFAPSLRNNFVNLDDPPMLLQNPFYRGFGPAQLGWMFTTFHMGHYQPLTWMTLALDHALWGLDARGYHLTNLLLHLANTGLVYRLALLVYRLSASAAASPSVAAGLAALLFGLHPLRVESVAWVTERRDVLSGFFLLLAVIAWLRYAPEAQASSGRARWYAVSLGSYALSLLSKAWGMTLPLVLVVLDAWPLDRWRRDGRRAVPRRSLIVEKIPHAVLGLAAAGVALMAQGTSGAMVGLATLGPVQRLMQMAYGLCFYVRKTVLPLGLSPLYLLDRELDPLRPVYLASAAIVLLVAVILVALRRRWPAGVVAFLCYAIVVSPVLGATQSGLQIAADRYTYLSCIPFALLAGAGLGALPPGSVPGRVAAALAALVLALLGTLTWRQTHVWHDSERLWTRAVEVDPGHWFAYQMRGGHYLQAGDPGRARADLDHSIAINPRNPVAYLLRGSLRAPAGDVPGALEDWDRALELDPTFFEALYDRGVTRLGRGDVEGGTSDLEEAVRVNPASSVAWYRLAAARARAGRVDPAIDAYRRALGAAPPDWPQRPDAERALAGLLARRRAGS